MYHFVKGFLIPFTTLKLFDNIHTYLSDYALFFEEKLESNMH